MKKQRGGRNHQKMGKGSQHKGMMHRGMQQQQQGPGRGGMRGGRS